MEINIAFLFVIAGMALMIGFKNSRIQYLKDERNHYKKVAEKLEQYLKDERNHYKKVAEKLEQDINNLTQGK